MPVDTQEIIELVRKIADEEKLRITFRECAQAGLIVGITTAAGGLLAGPIGLLFAAPLAIGLAYAKSKEFKSALQIIADMEEEDKEMLAEQVRRIMSTIDVSDIAGLSDKLSKDKSIRQEVIMTLVDSLKSKMSMTAVDH